VLGLTIRVPGCIELPLNRPTLLGDSTTMKLTTTNQTKLSPVLWRLLTLIVGVIAFIGLSAGTASAFTATSTVSSSGQTVVGLETRVGTLPAFG
jgi:hypothetical protein